MQAAEDYWDIEDIVSYDWQTLGSFLQTMTDFSGGAAKRLAVVESVTDAIPLYQRFSPMVSSYFTKREYLTVLAQLHPDKWLNRVDASLPNLAVRVVTSAFLGVLERYQGGFIKSSAVPGTVDAPVDADQDRSDAAKPTLAILDKPTS